MGIFQPRVLPLPKAIGAPSLCIEYFRRVFLLGMGSDGKNVGS